MPISFKFASVWMTGAILLAMSPLFFVEDCLAQEAVASPKEHWYPASRSGGFSINASGSVFDSSGANVVIDSFTSAEQPSGGSLPLDGASMRRHTVNLSAVIDVSKGHGAAALWIRADGQDGVLELINTGLMP